MKKKLQDMTPDEAREAGRKYQERMTRAKKKVVKAWAIFSDLGDSIAREVRRDINETDDLRKQIARQSQMPRESFEDALARHHVVPCTITYTLPTRLSAKKRK